MWVPIYIYIYIYLYIYMYGAVKYLVGYQHIGQFIVIHYPLLKVGSYSGQLIT